MFSPYHLTQHLPFVHGFIHDYLLLAIMNQVLVTYLMFFYNYLSYYLVSDCLATQPVHQLSFFVHCFSRIIRYVFVYLLLWMCLLVYVAWCAHRLCAHALPLSLQLTMWCDSNWPFSKWPDLTHTAIKSKATCNHNELDSFSFTDWLISPLPCPQHNALRQLGLARTTHGKPPSWFNCFIRSSIAYGFSFWYHLCIHSPNLLVIIMQSTPPLNTIAPFPTDWL